MTKNKKIDIKMPLIDHFTEFRRRFIIYLISFLFIFSLCWSYKELLLKIFTYPLLNNKSVTHLISTKITEIFSSYIEISFIAAFIISIPILILQVILFISPALMKQEKKNMYYFIFSSFLLFVIGALFAYFAIIPIVLEFFLSFQQIKQVNLSLNIEPKISEYITLIKYTLLDFAIAFQLPIILIILVKMGLISINNLCNGRRYAILLSFIIGAILTPPDVISQIILAIPLIILYEGSVLYIKYATFSKNKIN